jgi:integrase
MSFVEIPTGAPVASKLPRSASGSASVSAKVESLADLLAYINTQPTSQTPMMRTTVAKVAAFLGDTVDKISLDMIHVSREGFRPYLESQRYKEGSIRSYVNYLRMLMDTAENIGWKPLATLAPEWVPVLELAKWNSCLPTMKYLAQIRRAPKEVTAEHVDQWIKVSVGQGNRYTTARQQVNAAWRTLVACGFVKHAPMTYLRKKQYGVPVLQLPQPLQAQVKEMVRWKSAEYEPDRPNEAKVREISAMNMQKTICSMFGYATKIAMLHGIESVPTLIQKHVVGSYITWCINDQKIKGGPLLTQLAAVLAAVSKHPAHQTLDVSWFRPLLATITVEPYEAVKIRKAKKYLSYEVLEAIPEKIRAILAAEAEFGEHHIARLAMDGLMLRWLLILPWRQRNLRECRVSGEDPNIFKAKIPEGSSIDLPEWAQRAEAQDPNVEFWQVRFGLEETKTEVAVHSLLPLQLIDPLEEYLRLYRPLLLNGRACETLFVAPEAEKIGDRFITDAISNLTVRFGGRRATPHIFRDIVAYAWLKAHPKDYLTLSKMLWHKQLSTTINQYGSRYNVSSATVAMESWIEERESGARQK